MRILRTILLGTIVVLWPALSVASAVTVAWDANVDGLTTGYVIAAGPSNLTYTMTIDVGLVTTYTLDLAPGTVYFIAVQAHAADGRVSGYSNEITAEIPPLQPPSPPMLTSLALTSNVRSPQSVGLYVTWTATAAGGVPPYEFRYSSQRTGGMWIIGRDWNSVTSWMWAPTVGDYTIRVESRSANTPDVELSQTMPFSIVKHCKGNKCR